MDQITEALAAALTAMDDENRELPFRVAALANNGAYLVGTYLLADDGGLTCDVAAMSDGLPFVLPVNVMLTDSHGGAVRVLIADEHEMTLTHLH